MVFLERHHCGFEPIIVTWWERFIKVEEDEYIEKEKQKEQKPGAVTIVVQKKGGKKGKEEEKPVEEEKKYVYNPPAYYEKIYNIIKTSITENLIPMRKWAKEEIPSVNINLVKGCLNLFEVMFNEYKALQHEKKDKRKVSDTETEELLINIFVFAFYWSLGGNLEDLNKSREKFSKEMKTYFAKYTGKDQLPKTDIYDFYLNLDTRKWEPWDNKVQKLEYIRNVAYTKILVDTNDTVRYKHILMTLNKCTINVLLMGSSGVGKSVIVKDYLAKLSKEEFVFAASSFSAQTSSTNIQDLIVDKLVQRGRNLGPPSGKKMIFFFDDINMPKLDKYGAQPPNELLRQVIDQGGFYDLKKYTFKLIKDCCMVAACSPPGGGKNPVTPRLFRHFHMLWMPDLSSKSMELIFKSILKGYLLLEKETASFERTADNLIKASVDVYLTIKSKLLPTPSKSHYTFNLRDLSKVVQGCLQMDHFKFTNPDSLVRLWAHEECRIFHDRLVNTKDRDQFYEIL